MEFARFLVSHSLSLSCILSFVVDGAINKVSTKKRERERNGGEKKKKSQRRRVAALIHQVLYISRWGGMVVCNSDAAWRLMRTNSRCRQKRNVALGCRTKIIARPRSSGAHAGVSRDSWCTVRADSSISSTTIAIGSTLYYTHTKCCCICIIDSVTEPVPLILPSRANNPSRTNSGRAVPDDSTITFRPFSFLSSFRVRHVPS